MFYNRILSGYAVFFKRITMAKIKVYVFVSKLFNLRPLEFWKPFVNIAIHIARPKNTNMYGLFITYYPFGLVISIEILLFKAQNGIY